MLRKIQGLKSGSTVFIDRKIIFYIPADAGCQTIRPVGDKNVFCIVAKSAENLHQFINFLMIFFNIEQ